jgi:hypothetical protein
MVAVCIATVFCSMGKRTVRLLVGERGVVMTTTMKYATLDLGTIEAVFNKLGGMDGAQRFLSGKLMLVDAQPPKPEQLLSRITTAQVIGSQRFVCDKAALKKANIGWTGSNFDQHFLGMNEKNVDGANLAVHKLERNSLDSPIRTELGERERTAIAWMIQLIEAQKNGEKGVLLTNGCANIFYIVGKDGNVWAVDAYWDSCSHYWRVGAGSVAYPY